MKGTLGTPIKSSAFAVAAMLGFADGTCAMQANERDPETDEVFARASFDATIDELVEVALRVGFSSPAVRHARRRAMLFAAAGASIAVLVAASLRLEQT